ncbi:hypothetical protein Aperf_G00000103092 [Anoplocephala perfoliata]
MDDIGQNASSDMTVYDFNEVDSASDAAIYSEPFTFIPASTPMPIPAQPNLHRNHRFQSNPAGSKSNRRRPRKPTPTISEFIPKAKTSTSLGTSYAFGSNDAPTSSTLRQSLSMSEYYAGVSERDIQNPLFHPTMRNLPPVLPKSQESNVVQSTNRNGHLSRNFSSNEKRSRQLVTSSSDTWKRLSRTHELSGFGVKPPAKLLSTALENSQATQSSNHDSRRLFDKSAWQVAKCKPEVDTQIRFRSVQEIQKATAQMNSTDSTTSLRDSYEKWFETKPKKDSFMDSIDAVFDRLEMLKHKARNSATSADALEQK